MGFWWWQISYRPSIWCANRNSVERCNPLPSLFALLARSLASVNTFILFAFAIDDDDDRQPFHCFPLTARNDMVDSDASASLHDCCCCCMFIALSFDCSLVYFLQLSIRCAIFVQILAAIYAIELFVWSKPSREAVCRTNTATATSPAVKWSERALATVYCTR